MLPDLRRHFSLAMAKWIDQTIQHPHSSVIKAGSVPQGNICIHLLLLPKVTNDDSIIVWNGAQFCYN